MKAKILRDIKKYLVAEEIYTPKDEITLVLLENTYNQYIESSKHVKLSGVTLIQRDSNGFFKTVPNPNFRIQIECQRELFKLIDSLYLTPKSRKSKKEKMDITDDSNPFLALMKDIAGHGDFVEKR